MDPYDFAVNMHRQLSTLLHQVSEQHNDETKTLRDGLSMCVESVEQFLQPELSKRLCVKCHRSFESVSAMGSEHEQSEEGEEVEQAKQRKHMPRKQREKARVPVEHTETDRDGDKPNAETDDKPKAETETEASSFPAHPLEEKKKPAKPRKKNVKTMVKELPASQSVKKACSERETRTLAKQIVSQLPAVWCLPDDTSALTQTMSFVPGQPPSTPLSFSNFTEASQIYVQQSRFGRKIDVYTRFACGRCARPFYEYEGGPSRTEAAAAREDVAKKRVNFRQFCSDILGVDHAIVRAEVWFSLLCDYCPPLLNLLAQPENAPLFRWSSFVEQSTETYNIWMAALKEARSSLQPVQLLLDLPQPPSASTFPMLQFVPPNPQSQSPSPERQPHTHAEQQQPEALAEPQPFKHPPEQQPQTSAEQQQPQTHSQKRVLEGEPDAAKAKRPRLDDLLLAAEVSESVKDAEEELPDRCSICHGVLGVELDTDDKLERTRWDAVSRALKESKNATLAKRRVRLNCAHEFCYGCAVSHYLQNGNKCPLCQRRFTDLASRDVPDRDGTQPLPRRTLPSVDYVE